jgi:uncharacterized metal-binding protein
MAMQSDVLASQPATVSGQLKTQSGANIGRARVKSIYIVPGTLAGSVVFQDNGSSGATVMTINTVASATQPTWILVPDQGALFQNNIYVTLTNVGSVMVFYA